MIGFTDVRPEPVVYFISDDDETEDGEEEAKDEPMSNVEQGSPVRYFSDYSNFEDESD